MKTLCHVLAVIGLFAAGPAYADRPVPFRVGEVLTYDVSWTGYVSAGTASITVKERRNAGGGKAAYYALAEAKPSSFIERVYHLYYKAESLLDTDTLRPSMATTYSDERGRTRQRTMTFLAGDMVDLEVKTATLVRESVKVEPQSYDALAAIYALRAIPLRQGQTVVIPVVNNGRMYRARVYAAGRETLDTELGRLPALRLALTITDGQGNPSTTRDITLWLSEDARRLPLRLTVGLPVGNFALALSRASQ